MFLRKPKLTDLLLIIAFAVSFVCFIAYVYGSFNGLKYYGYAADKATKQDEFDSSLARLNTMNRLSIYCDSFFQQHKTDRTYPAVVAEVIRKRFYHEYSYYDFSTNPVAVILEPVVQNGATAIVIPDDIIKYAHAACSQQSIVGMEVFKRKGYPVRKVSMFDSVSNSGHFAYEVYYDKGWHYFDTDQEPDQKVLRRYGRPSTAYLAQNPAIILEAYKEKSNPEMFKRLILNYKLGPVNKFPAPNAYFFQVTTKAISYLGWLFFLILLIFRYRLSYSKAKSSDSYSSKKQVPAFS